MEEIISNYIEQYYNKNFYIEIKLITVMMNEIDIEANRIISKSSKKK